MFVVFCCILTPAASMLPQDHPLLGDVRYSVTASAAWQCLLGRQTVCPASTNTHETCKRHKINCTTCVRMLLPCRYIKIHRGGNDCGIASDAAFADVSPEYVVPGAAKRALQLVLSKSRGQ